MCNDCDVNIVECMQGGFAKCYELTDVKTGKTYAGKIIAKARIVKSNQKEKVGCSATSTMSNTHVYNRRRRLTTSLGAQLPRLSFEVFSERSRSLYVAVRPSVCMLVCNVRAPYSGD